MGGMGMDVLGVDELTDTIGGINDSLRSPDYIVGTATEYAIFLEKGSSKMPPYPFMEPAVDKVMAEQADRIADAADSVGEVVSGIANAIEAEAKRYASDNVPPGPDEITSTLKNSIRAVPVGELG
jgi:hypothetical protein